MNRNCFITLIGLFAGVLSYGQKSSKGDQYFFEYNYAQAITAYELEQKEDSLNSQQSLNLAESYFKTRNYKQAANLYMSLYKAEKPVRGKDFNLMLQSLSKISSDALKDGTIDLRAGALSDELIENASFNFELLQGNLVAALDYQVMPIAGNSPQDDFAPSFFGGNRILFSSNRSSGNKEESLGGQAYTAVFVGRIGELGDVSQVNALPWLPELPFHEATPFFSAALNSVFYVRSNTENGELTFDENGKNTLAICLANEENSFMELLSTTSTSFYYPYYEDATERLFFAADFPQGYGGTDLYYVMTSKGKIMSSPVNLGPKINTPGNEIAPYIFEGNLYFASDVFYGLGGMDIYKSQMGIGTSFSTPTNLGPGINSAADDFGFVIRSGETFGFEGYFASNRPGGRGGDDIYHYAVPDTPGLKTLMVQGMVIDSSTEFGLTEASVLFVDANDNVLKEATSAQDGSFRIEMPWQQDVRLIVSKERFSRVVYAGQVAEALMVSGQPVRVTISPIEAVVQQLRGQNVLNLDRFYFNSNSSELDTEIRLVLDQAVQQLKDFPSFTVRVEAHTNSLGSAYSNEELSQARANAIRQYLIANGISENRILEAKGYGETQIVNHCVDGVYCLEVLHRQNERYPIVVLNYED
ncbi:MAG: hypothetical protein RLZZ241_103 [Bacteroidota bacterium]|jgi:outer membrane protein OmpA-like peptidoglycan-associated protein